MILPTPSLDADRLGWALLQTGLLSVGLSAVAGEVLGPHSSGNRDVQVVRILVTRPGTTPSEIVERTGLAPSTVSRIVGHLVADGLVRRRPNPRDRRSSLLTPCDGTADRLAQFEDGLVAVLAGHRHTLRQLVAVLDPDGNARPTERPLGAGEVTAHLAHVGAAFLEDILVWAPDYGLTNFSDRTALSIVSHHGTVSPSRLARDLHLSSGGTTLMVERMESNRLVRRRKPKQPSDRRAVEVTCTPRGATAMARMLDHFADHATAFARAFAYATMLPDGATVPGGPEAVTA